MKRFFLFLFCVFTFSCGEKEASSIKLEYDPEASFTFEQSTTNPFMFSFENTSQHADSSHWDFGDGNTTFEENPEYAYEKEGTFDVILTVFSEDEEKFDTDTKSVTIESLEKCTPEIEESAISHSSKDINITFKTDEITFGQFGDISSEITENLYFVGENVSCKVTKVIKLTGCNATNSGTAHNLKSSIDFSTITKRKFTIDVYAETEATAVTLTIENEPYPNNSVSHSVTDTIEKTERWEKLEFDFPEVREGTFKSFVLHFDKGGACNGQVYYFDNITQEKGADSAPPPIAMTKDGKNLVWSDEFDGTSVDRKNWKFETGATGWGNNEWQNYTSGANAEVSEGTLKIIAKKIGSGQKIGDYTSTRMISAGLQEFKYGIFEIRAKMPEHKGNGLWPAIWMLGANFFSGTPWPDCGEIDILEYVSHDPNVAHSALHNGDSYGDTQYKADAVLATIEEEFHNYGIIWTENSIKFYLDKTDNIIYTYDPSTKNAANWPYDKPFFFLLNIAVGGNWGGVQGVDDTIFPATMEIDYVRVYQ